MMASITNMLGYRTQLQYLSGVMAKLSISTISIGPPPHPDAKWYIELHRGLKMRGRVLAIKRCEAVAKITGGITQETLMDIDFELMKIEPFVIHSIIPASEEEKY
jgi:hypothetical protein